MSEKIQQEQQRQEPIASSSSSSFIYLTISEPEDYEYINEAAGSLDTEIILSQNNIRNRLKSVTDINDTDSEDMLLSSLFVVDFNIL